MEVLVRNPSLPRRVGKARMVYDYPLGGSQEAKRDKEHIVLPPHPQARMHLFKDKKKFLFETYLKPPQNYLSHLERAIYFGGMDEEPFLVRMEPSVWPSFEKHGEEGFLESLKPEDVKHFEKSFSVTSKRQGDIFAVPMPLGLSFEALTRLANIQKAAKEVPRGPGNVLATSVFGTRHTFSGVEIDLRIPGIGNGVEVFREGTLKAPDHEPLILEGVHIFRQNKFLFDPPNAD